MRGALPPNDKGRICIQMPYTPVATPSQRSRRIAFYRRCGDLGSYRRSSW